MCAIEKVCNWTVRPSFTLFSAELYIIVTVGHSTAVLYHGHPPHPAKSQHDFSVPLPLSCSSLREE